MRIASLFLVFPLLAVNNETKTNLCNPRAVFAIPVAYRSGNLGQQFASTRYKARAIHGLNFARYAINHELRQFWAMHSPHCIVQWSWSASGVTAHLLCTVYNIKCVSTLTNVSSMYICICVFWCKFCKFAPWKINHYT
jgi:hypothetical protein